MGILICPEGKGKQINFNLFSRCLGIPKMSVIATNVSYLSVKAF